MAVTKIQPTGVNSEASFTFANVTATGNVLTSNLSVSGNLALTGPNINLGPVANIKITGGTNGYVLKTDGTGNLDWVAQSGGGGGGTPGGSNTHVQFNDGSSFGGSANFTFDKTTNVLSVNGNVIAGNANLGNLATANFFSGSGNLLSNIQGANVSGAVAYATTANSVAGSNVSGEVAYAATANSVAGSNVSGAVSYATTANSVSGSNVSGAVAYATTANSVSGSNVSGEVSYAATANAVAGSNVSGQVSNALIAGTVYTNAQPNITSVGTLASLSVSGNANIGNIALTGTIVAGTGSGGNITNADYVIANFFQGNGSLLTSLTGANVTGQVAYAATANAVAGGNVSGQVANALVSGTVYTNAQPNITSVGTLTSLSVSGNALVTGNLIVDGTTTYVNTTNILVQDPIIEQGGGANGAALTTNDGKDRGIVSHYYSGATIDAFMGWDNSNAEFSFGSNVSMSGEVATFNTLGNIRSGNASLGNLVTASFFSGSGNLLSNIQGSNVTGAVAYATTANAVAGSNVTGAVAYATTANAVSGSNVTGAVAYATTANAVSGSNVSGEVAFAATANSVAGGNVSGTVSSATTATTAATVTTASQPNITSVGTLTGLTVGPNSSIVLSGTTGYVKANSLQGLDGSQALFLGHSGVAGAIGVVTNLIVGTGGTGNLNANGTISASGNVTGSYFIGNGSALTSINGANVTGQVANALIAGTVYTNAQPNITSTGILTSVSVTGDANVGNLNTAGAVSATGNVSAGNVKTDNLLYANGAAWSLGGGGSYGNSNVATFLASFGSNTLVTTGNVTTGNLIFGSGVVTGTGTITAGNLAVGSGYLSTTGNANVGNVFVASTGVVSTAGTITAGNLAFGAGFVSGTGLVTAGNLSATANVIAGNVLTNNLLYANGAAWSFGGGSYGNSNVATYLASFGSNTISTTGTVTTGALNATGLLSSTGNLYARGEARLWYTSYSDPDSMEIRALKIGDSGMAVLGGIKTDTFIANYSMLTSQSLGSVSGSTAINLNSGAYVQATSGGSTTWSFTNVPASNAVGVVLELTNGGAYAQSWGTIKWPGGVAPTLIASGVDVLVFITDDGGTTWRGVLSMTDSR
jgi:hypothetical protein